MKTIFTRLLPAALALLTAGCSKEPYYYMLHDIAQQQCRDIINPEERQACEAQHNKSYREYEAEHYSEEKAQ